MNDPVEIVAGFDRPNIRLEVSAFQDAAAKERFVVERAAVEEKPGILYAGTRKAADGYAEQLSELGLAAASYHAGLSAAERREAQDRFSSGELDVVVATSAFGMGIDKADVRFVLHASVPGSLDAYYQEIGRAGRDGRRPGRSSPTARRIWACNASSPPGLPTPTRCAASPRSCVARGPP